MEIKVTIDTRQLQ